MEQNSELFRFAHKVTFDNYDRFVEDDFWKDTLIDSTEFNNEKYLSYLHLTLHLKQLTRISKDVIQNCK